MTHQIEALAVGRLIKYKGSNTFLNLLGFDMDTVYEVVALTTGDLVVVHPNGIRTPLKTNGNMTKYCDDFVLIPIRSSLPRGLLEVDPSLELPQELTEKEIDVLHELMKGQSDQEIGKSLGMAKKTAKFHLLNIYRKLGINSRSQAILWCVKYFKKS